MERLRNKNFWPALATALGVGVIVLLVLGISGLSDLPGRPGAPEAIKPPTPTATTPQERAAEVTAAATGHLSEVNKYNAELTAWASDRASRRTGSLALLAGAVALLTAALGAAAHGETVRKNRGDAKGAAATRADERFATAIEHLSSDQSGVQIGGIYSLEALAREDEDRIETVVQVLLAFTEPWWERAREWADVPHGFEPYPAAPRFRLAFETAARSRTSEVIANFDLSFADLTRADLGGADLRGANLRGVVLTGADLRLSSLDGAQLQHAILIDAQLEDAQLANARLDKAKLNGADLSHAKLRYTSFNGADLSGVVFTDFDLQRVDLTGANLEGADLSGADLTGTPIEGANLIGAVGLGSHSSHSTLDVDALFLDKRVHVPLGAGALPGQVGVIKAAHFGPGDRWAHGGLSFDVLFEQSGSTELVPNEALRKGDLPSD